MAPWKQHYIHRRRIIKMYKNKIMYLYTDPLVSERATASRQARQSTASETSFGMQWFRTTTLSPVRVNIIIILMVYSCMRNMVRRHACPASRKSWCDFLKWNIMRYALARIFAFVFTILLTFSSSSFWLAVIVSNMLSICDMRPRSTAPRTTKTIFTEFLYSRLHFCRDVCACDHKGHMHTIKPKPFLLLPIFVNIFPRFAIAHFLNDSISNPCRCCFSGCCQWCTCICRNQD